MRPLLLTLFLLLAAAAACSEPGSLVIKLGAPATLILGDLQGSLRLELLDGNTGLTLQDASVGAGSLKARQKLFSGLDLEEGRSYRVRVVISLNKSEKACAAGGGGRVLGQSTIFRHGQGGDGMEVGLYLDCADRSSATGALSVQRVYHSATWVSGAGQAGEVLVAGGSKFSLQDINDLTKATIHNTVEAYDPVKGTFSLISTRLSQKRIFHQAVAAPGGAGVLLSGGVDVRKDKKGMTLLDLMERVGRGGSTGLTSMLIGRYRHGALLLRDDRLLLAGGWPNIYSAASAELFDPKKGIRINSEGYKLLEPRATPRAIGLGDGRRALLVGGQLVPQATPHKEELFHLSGKAPCGKTPCFQPIPGFGGKTGRFGLAAARVACSAQEHGAIYIVGGTVADPVTKAETHLKEIYCFDTKDPTRVFMVGETLHQRTGHSVIVVRGPGGGKRLFVAGGTVTMATLAELIPVQCSCKAINRSSIKTVKMVTWRSNHTATALPDGTVLLTGGFLEGSAERFTPAF